MTEITTTELPETLQNLLIEVEQTKIPLTILHEGKPLAIVYPATNPIERPSFGVIKGTGEILGDIIEPVAEAWDVLA
ncbi:MULTISPECIES: hypothetical protein [unclassified Roseofilum]|uniref:hypothetical protein n=1 Tax=unclassified Roseofilum TaxID=2620099 RepID=UPI000E91DAFF|nr:MULTISPECIES: hypothetical protein [unclassified Roseofilum]HBQ98233.1 prevent-host-death family protein [Cyanobacteria bacterium UBA11691]MBP0009553.1 type II toxin-antitoxin system Phd/YefM family antitoxin [Roseofilum sp. Belize Diploria]MBP0013722.1 type II toxin-antitoxin system Phd/YefM family antitoxin [Roseofilum sp. SID3]MBP0024935.1 type II toxin-antitoxin system Phd/YefM family antitoxin [Roseofilum sp. SID2]MBP0032715.1 type II toxin-antitoxin system Phd/YefM family antitoxin [R